MFAHPFWKRLLRIARASLLAVPLVAIPVLVMAAIVGPSVAVKVDGTIGSGTENVGFCGQLDVTSRIIDDPDFHAPTMLELTVDFSSVKGVGKGNGRKFATEAQTIIHRPLLAFDTVELTFPYTPGNDVHSARAATVTIDVSYSATSGLRLSSKVTGAPSNQPNS